jgi:Bifunctional DNA primase/polymerase, N-terminal
MNEDGEAAWERMDKAYVYRLALLAGGYVPIPLNGKRPANTAWQSDVAPDESEIASWKTTCGSAFNTGILTKWTPAIDIDVTDGGVANAIADRAAELIEEDAPMAVRFGKHPKRAILFRTDEPFDKIRTSDFASPDGATHHVEILCDGQQLAAFGRHPETGNEYEWPKGAPGSIRQSELPLLTKAMAKQLVDAAADIMRRAGWEEKKSKRRAENGAKGPTALAGEGGYRERQYAKAALDGCANQLANSTPGGRNDALNKAAFRLGTMIARGWIPRATVEQRLYEAAVQNGSVKDDGSIAALATIKSGIEAGLREPHADLQNREPDHEPGQTASAPEAARPTNGQARSSDDQWPVMDEAAYYGSAGDVVRTIEPHSEADPVAILLHVLAYVGNIIGIAPHYRVEADDHRANIYAVLVGQSAKGRKGTASGRARAVVRTADERWAEDRMKGGLSSGEGLINEVRDELKKWDSKKREFEVIDPGIVDKRLMITEAEFGNALAVMERPGNTLSPTIRQAWDGRTLSAITKNSPLKATGAHISIIGHITEDELRARITRTEMANGFANRFLFVCVRRSKRLPHGGTLADAELATLRKHVREAVEFAKTVGRVTMTAPACRLWEAVYPVLSADQPGLLGAITARGEAQTIRLALIYALLDHKDQIDEAHLKGALAVWEYCEASAARIFGGALGDPVADEIQQALRQAGSAGMTRTAIRDLFGRNRSGDRIGTALALLMSKGRARAEMTVTTGGRPAETWFAVGKA